MPKKDNSLKSKSKKKKGGKTKQNKKPVKAAKPKMKPSPKKVYKLSFTHVTGVLKRIEENLDKIETNFDNLNAMELSNYFEEYEENVQRQDYIDFLTNINFELLDTVLMTAWLLFPQDFLEYLQSEESAHPELGLNKLAEIAIYGDQLIEYEFMDTEILPEPIFPFIRQYKSLDVLVSNTLGELQKYDTLIAVINELVDDIYEFLDEYSDELSIGEIAWYAIALCEFESVLPSLIPEIDSEVVRQRILQIQNLAEKHKLEIIKDYIQNHIEQAN